MIKMIKEVKAWRTTDGEIHDNKKYAELKQGYLDNRNWFLSNKLPDFHRNEEHYNWIIENKEDIIEMIEKSN